MKFEYDVKEGNKGCVAFLDGDNDLWFSHGNGYEYICVTGEFDGLDESDAHVKFYPGDKITITF